MYSCASAKWRRITEQRNFHYKNVQISFAEGQRDGKMRFNFRALKDGQTHFVSSRVKNDATNSSPLV